MFGMGWQELLLIAFIVMVLFGAKKVPEVFRSLGKSIHSFKEGMREGEDEIAGRKKTDKEV